MCIRDRSNSDDGTNDNRNSSNNNNSKPEIPDFMTQKPLLSRTTTEVDTNPVLSDMQISAPIGLELTNERRESSNGDDVQDNRMTIRSNIALPLPKLTKDAETPNLHSESLQRTLTNDSTTDFDVLSKTDSENPSLGLSLIHI